MGDRAAPRPIANLMRFWRGEYSLAMSFWVFYIIGFPVAIIASFFIAIPAFVLGITPITQSLPLWPFVYLLWAGLGVWRSANAYPFTGIARFWAWSAKFVVIIFDIAIFGMFLNGGVAQLIAAFTS